MNGRPILILAIAAVLPLKTWAETAAAREFSLVLTERSPAGLEAASGRFSLAAGAACRPGTAGRDEELAAAPEWPQPEAESGRGGPALRQDVETRAEIHLRLFAADKKRSRTLNAIVGGAGTALTAAILVSATRDEPENWAESFGQSLAVVIFAPIGIASAATLAWNIVPSGAERQYARVRALADPLQREQAGREALHALARAGRRSRLISGGLAGALALLSLERELGRGFAMFGSLAAYELFIRKSKGEKVLAAVPDGRKPVAVEPGDRDRAGSSGRPGRERLPDFLSGCPPAAAGCHFAADRRQHPVGFKFDHPPPVRSLRRNGPMMHPGPAARPP